MTSFKALRTARLDLRLLQPADAQDINAYQSLPKVVRYTSWKERTLDETREHLAKRLLTTGLEKDGDVLVVGVELARPVHPFRLIGEITVFLHSVANGRAEIGWAFHPDSQGHGYASEAAGRMLDWTFAELDVHRIEAHLDERNTASAAVCTRLGMQKDALLRENLHFKGEWADTAIYGILRDERAAFLRERALGAATGGRPASSVGRAASSVGGAAEA